MELYIKIHKSTHVKIVHTFYGNKCNKVVLCSFNSYNIEFFSVIIEIRFPRL